MAKASNSKKSSPKKPAPKKKAKKDDKPGDSTTQQTLEIPVDTVDLL